MPIASWRSVLLVALSLTAAACSRKSAPIPDDPAFESRWQQLASSGSEALVVGDEGAQPLSANVRRAARPKLETARPPATGGLPEAPRGDDVQKVIRKNLSSVKGCYVTASRQGSGRSGKAIVTFAIGPSGRPTNVRVDAPSFKGTGLPTCLSSQVSFWSFPRSKKGAETVSYPFVFVGG